MKPLTLTAVFRRFPAGYAAWVEELPGANSQGATLAEARENLAEAIQLVLEANRELSMDAMAGGHEAVDEIREALLLQPA
jgi:predicted RNase H-like HicB family nuclease